MNHKEKLIEIINNVIRCDECGIVPEWLAEDLIVYGVTVQGWISVKDRLPEMYKPVLTLRKKLDDCGHYQKVDYVVPGGGDLAWLTDLESWKSKVTHWMPLPQPPKGE